ncbi:MAG: hypothetical protein DCF15_18555 [Phormidesmis priestleyi]|uniref:Uncharacterized protein n=1 Tax=Phormidesmis priestleyi TaxID=268141 RepID=A0A2W4WRQ4_9CYAN|nr:MAG: hypothetical protein DCF15_18555 [Phormidesmis priestleyi]
MLGAHLDWYAFMSNQQTVLTALGCAGSLAVMLAISSPTIASSVTANSVTVPDASLDYSLPALVQNESNPITDALGCTCAVCTGGVQRPIF